MSPREYPTFGPVVFYHHIASGHAWQGWVKDFGIFIFPFGMIFHQPAFLECISMVYLEDSSWLDDMLWEFHPTIALKALQITTDASYWALLFWPSCHSQVILFHLVKFITPQGFPHLDSPTPWMQIIVAYQKSSSGRGKNKRFIYRHVCIL